MTQYERELSNLSYTNKDFQTIYPELLELAKNISYKWDPTTSDESDPGVVLLKLAALMTDKLNYNIDKNILELYPLSVTQLDNARQIFEQCGYNMHYYKSATTEVSIMLKDEPEISDDSAMLGEKEVSALDKTEYRIYEIPKFTMITTADNDVVYTTTAPTFVNSKGDKEYVTAIQGVIQRYEINGESIITTLHIDYNNRIYFTDLDVAENGIFVFNSGSSEEWEMVENLYTQPYGKKCYKFGLTHDGKSCYIEFPTDFDSIVGDGLEIYYVRTKGADGNVSKKLLNKLYEEKVKCSGYIVKTPGRKDTEIELTNDNLYIINNDAGSNGKNPESIEEAYRNYQRVKNTFDTLISLKDYTNFIISNKVVSNGFVCDRCNDPQSSYKILKNFGDEDTLLETVFQKDGDGKNIMSAFDLKMYGFRYMETTNTADRFKNSFTPIQLAINTNGGLFDDIKCIQHDIKSIDPESFVMFKNKYPITAKIIPYYKLTTVQQSDVIVSIYTSLCNTLNSKLINFGDRIDYDVVYDTIAKSDPRIKAVILENIEYETYAVFLNKNKTSFIEVRIDHLADIDVALKKTTDTSMQIKKVYYYNDQGEWKKLVKVADSGQESFATGVDYYEMALSTESSTSGVNTKSINLWDTMRADIFAKSILGGVTPLFEKDTPFTSSTEFSSENIVYNVATVDTDAKIEVELNAQHKGSVVVKPNENIVFTSPNLITDREFSTYTKMFYKLNSQIPSNFEYTLGAGEYIAFFWKSDDAEDAPYKSILYTKDTKIKGLNVNIICPTFGMVRKQTSPGTKEGYSRESFDSGILGQLKNGVVTDVPTANMTTYVVGEDGSTIDVDVTLNDYLADFADVDEYVLTGTHMVYTKKINEINIKDSSSNIYWITNNISVSSEGVEQYNINFNNEGSYTLKNGEYFIYSNATGSRVTMLGSGTKITYSGKQNKTLSCEYISYDTLMNEGVDCLQSVWVPLTSDCYATEMAFYQLGAEAKVTFEATTSAINKGVKKIIINNDGILFTDASNPPQLLDLTLSDFTTIYNVDETSSPVTLAKKNSSKLAWSCSSILNLSCSLEKSQKILNNVKISSREDATHTHKIVLHTVDGVDKDITTLMNDSDITYINTSKEISITGGDGVSVATLNIYTGENDPTHFEIFGIDKDSEINSLNTLYVDELKEKKLLSSKKTVATPYLKEHVIEENDVPFALAEGDYILKVYVSTDLDGGNALEVTRSTGNITVEQLLESSTGNTKSGSYYFKVSVLNKNESNALKVFCSSDKEFYVSLYAPYKYVVNKFIEEIPTISTEIIGSTTIREIPFYELLMDKLSELDRGNEDTARRVFDYTYQVPEQSLILNPLDSMSFVTTSHIFNQYTICEWDVSDKDENAQYRISVTNNIK